MHFHSFVTKFTYRFSDPDLEAQFRNQSLSRDTEVATALLWITICFQIISFPTDLLLLKGSDTLYVVWGIRVVSAVIAGVTLLYIRRAEKSISSFENAIFIWAVLLLIGIVGANALFPADYTIHVGWDILLALAVYTVVPLSMNRQMATALVISMGDVLLFWQYKALNYPGAFFDIFTVFVCVNVLGIFAAWELHRWRRQQFNAHQNEVEARYRLEKALLEIKTLKGIMPICSNCKNIRDDKGYWTLLESYIEKHSDASFSHGICPECTEKLYGNEDWYLQMKQDEENN